MSTSSKKIVQRAVNVETKVGLRFTTIVLDLDSCDPKGHCLFYNTFSKMQTQGFNNKDSFYSKIPKPNNLKLALSYNNIAEPAKIKDKKNLKKYFGDRNKNLPENRKTKL